MASFLPISARAHLRVCANVGPGSASRILLRMDSSGYIRGSSSITPDHGCVRSNCLDRQKSLSAHRAQWFKRDGLHCGPVGCGISRVLFPVALSAVVSGMCGAEGWYLSASGPLTVMSSSFLGIHSPGHRTLKSMRASWHFHSPSSSHHLLNSGTGHSSSTSAPRRLRCSLIALHTEFWILILAGECLQSSAWSGPLPLGLSQHLILSDHLPHSRSAGEAALQLSTVWPRSPYSSHARSLRQAAGLSFLGLLFP